MIALYFYKIISLWFSEKHHPYPPWPACFLLLYLTLAVHWAVCTRIGGISIAKTSKSNSTNPHQQNKEIKFVIIFVVSEVEKKAPSLYISNSRLRGDRQAHLNPAKVEVNKKTRQRNTKKQKDCTVQRAQKRLGREQK